MWFSASHAPLKGLKKGLKEELKEGLQGGLLKGGRKAGRQGGLQGMNFIFNPLKASRGFLLLVG